MARWDGETPARPEATAVSIQILVATHGVRNGAMGRGNTSPARGYGCFHSDLGSNAPFTGFFLALAGEDAAEAPPPPPPEVALLPLAASRAAFFARIACSFALNFSSGWGGEGEGGGVCFFGLGLIGCSVSPKNPPAKSSPRSYQPAPFHSPPCRCHSSPLPLLVLATRPLAPPLPLRPSTRPPALCPHSTPPHAHHSYPPTHTPARDPEPAHLT